jgi:hypothetical protein
MFWGSVMPLRFDNRLQDAFQDDGVEKRYQCSIGSGAIRGCKPEPPKILSPKIEPSNYGIQVDHFPIRVEGVVPVQQDVPPCRGRNLLD